MYEAELEIRAGSGPVGSTEISDWAIKYATFEGIFVLFSWVNEKFKVLSEIL